MEDRKDPIITSEDVNAFVSTLADFVRSYEQKAEDTSDGEWLLKQLAASLPEKGTEAVAQIRDAIISGIRYNEEVKSSLEAAQAKGISRDNWFAKRMKKATEGLNGEEAAKCMQSAAD